MRRPYSCRFGSSIGVSLGRNLLFVDVLARVATDLQRGRRSKSAAVSRLLGFDFYGDGVGLALAAAKPGPILSSSPSSVPLTFL